MGPGEKGGSDTGKGDYGISDACEDTMSSQNEVVSAWDQASRDHAESEAMDSYVDTHSTFGKK